MLAAGSRPWIGDERRSITLSAVRKITSGYFTFLPKIRRSLLYIIV